MDQSQSYPDPTNAARDEAPPIRLVSGAAPALSLVSGRFALGHGAEGVPQAWSSAIEALARTLEIDANWVAISQSSGLLQKARRAVGSNHEEQAPIFAPWKAISSRSIQVGYAGAKAPGAQWVMSHLFDFGVAAQNTRSPIDIALMSPCPDACVCDDAQIGPLPRMNTLAAMVRAATNEGRKRLAIVVRESAQATLASRLLGHDASLKTASLDVEFVSIEEVVVRLQRGALDWDAVIAMPEWRGILFAMLAQASGVSGPWPMLWFDRGLRLVTCELASEAHSNGDVDATALMQSLALTARHTGRHNAAKRLYEAWAAVRDSGVVTARRSSSAPYVNEIDEHAFLELVTSDRARSNRPVPSWMGLACEESATRTPVQPVRLSLVPSS